MFSTFIFFFLLFSEYVQALDLIVVKYNMSMGHLVCCLKAFGSSHMFLV